jgi:endoglucanase
MTFISWITCDSNHATLALGIKDPGNNFAFEMHQYFDSDYSGTKEECTKDGADPFKEATKWLKDNNRRAFLGEVGVARAGGCNDVLDKAFSFLDDNSDVWLGYSYWAAGPR